MITHSVHAVPAPAPAPGPLGACCREAPDQVRGRPRIKSGAGRGQSASLRYQSAAFHNALSQVLSTTPPRLSDLAETRPRDCRVVAGADLEVRVARLFDRVELPRSFLRRYPHELSGGQRQRAAIARALALNLMMELQAELGISYLLISHDMALVERVSQDLGVMYLGRLVELGPRAAVMEDPRPPTAGRC